jgi:hypothetical protein
MPTIKLEASYSLSWLKWEKKPLTQCPLLTFPLAQFTNTAGAALEASHMNTEANRPAVIVYVILHCKLCKGFEFLYVIWELCTKYPKLRLLSPRDRIKSWDENNIQEMKKRIKLVFSHKLVCTVVSSPDLDLPFACLHCCCSCCSSNQSLVKKIPANLVNWCPVPLNIAWFCSLYSYTRIGDETGTGGSN